MRITTQKVLEKSREQIREEQTEQKITGSGREKQKQTFRIIGEFITDIFIARNRQMSKISAEIRQATI